MTAVIAVAAFVVQVVPPFNMMMASIFIAADRADVVSIAAKDLQISSSMIWCIFANVVATTYFQSIGKPAVAIFLSMLRQGICLLPAIWILPYFMEDKALAIWLSMPISDVVCNAVTLIPLFLHANFIRKLSQKK